MKKLRGIIPPLVTPLRNKDELDIAGLERLTEHVISGGVHGVFILGTTGEGPSLSYRLRRDMIRRSCELTERRVPVLVGITDTAFVESVKLADYADKCGADAVVIAPPYYFHAGQEELREYIADLASEISLPIYLYNMPSHTKLVLEPETIEYIAEIKNIAGIKDSSGNMNYFHQLQHRLSLKKEFSVLIGPEEMLAEALFVGADGGVNGGANFWPRLYVDMFDAAQRDDWHKVRLLHEQIIEVSTALYSIGKFGSSYLKGVKCVLSLMNICSDTMAEPFQSFRKPERERVREALLKLGLII